MELIEFLKQTRDEVAEQIQERLDNGGAYPYAESVFTEVVMQHMADIGMTYDPNVCHYASKSGNANLRLSGYAVSDDGAQVDLFVSLYADVDAIVQIPDAETRNAAEQCLRFVARCAEGRLASSMDESNDAYPLAVTLQECYQNLEQISIYVLTDRVAKAKNFKAREVSGKTIRLEVMDIERLYRHWAAGKPRDELVVDFGDVAGGPLPCVYVKGELIDYDYALTVIPGEALRYLYERFGSRLLEANVRSFLGTTGRVNPGIFRTLRDSPERFLAFNNGIVIVTDEIRLGKAADGSPGIAWLKGMQIVNGGQTTASIYFATKKMNGIDLSKVRIPTKVIVLHSSDSVSEEALIADISRYANTQNVVKQSDLSANKPFHVEIERISSTVYCPDGVGRWFYERATGSYKVFLAREGKSAAKLRLLKEAIPPARRISKTDLAKYLNTWALKPEIVSRGTQKNFESFMSAAGNGNSEAAKIEPAEYKRMIAQAIIFRRATSLLRPRFPAFQANITAYTVALLSARLGEPFDLDRVWTQQDLSDPLKAQIIRWAQEVNDVLHRSSEGRMVSEWAKRPECWVAVRNGEYSAPAENIPEIR